MMEENLKERLQVIAMIHGRLGPQNREENGGEVPKLWRQVLASYGLATWPLTTPRGLLRSFISKLVIIIFTSSQQSTRRTPWSQ